MGSPEGKRALESWNLEKETSTFTRFIISSKLYNMASNRSHEWGKLNFLVHIGSKLFPRFLLKFISGCFQIFSITMALFIEIVMWHPDLPGCGSTTWSKNLSMNFCFPLRGWVCQTAFSQWCLNDERVKRFNISMQGGREIRMLHSFVVLELEWVRTSLLRIATRMEPVPIKQQAGWLQLIGWHYRKYFWIVNAISFAPGNDRWISWSTMLASPVEARWRKMALHLGFGKRFPRWI